MKATSLDEFYEKMAPAANVAAELRQFHVYDAAEVARRRKLQPMIYNRRAYYKINLIIGRSRVEYADKVIEVPESALLFATPKVPYRLVPLDDVQAGHFCVFTHEFLFQNGRDTTLANLPILKPESFPVFQVDADQAKGLNGIFEKMHRELVSDYAYKEDLLRNHLVELIHTGQKLRPMALATTGNTAADRVAELFMDLLDRQFPIDARHQRMELRSPAEFADRLAIHVNHLNKVLNATSGRSTSDLIHARMVQEAKIMLKERARNISEIAEALGFQEVAHFSHFFRKHTAQAPSAYRTSMIDRSVQGSV